MEAAQNAVLCWANEGASRRECIDRLMGPPFHLVEWKARREVRDANRLHGIGWPENVQVAPQEERDQAIADLWALAEKGVTRIEAIKTVTQGLTRTYSTVSRWATDAGVEFDPPPPKPVPVAEEEEEEEEEQIEGPPPAVLTTAQQIEMELVGKGFMPIASPCLLPDQSEWGIAVACGLEDLRIFLARDRDDFLRQWAETETKQGVKRHTPHAIALAFARAKKRRRTRKLEEEAV